MKTYLIILVAMVLSLSSCQWDQTKTDLSNSNNDTIPVKMTLEGRNIDTAYLYSGYSDPGAWISRTTDQCQYEQADVIGYVNTRIPGTYTLNYCGKGDAGRQVPTITRTVQVVANSAGFLNGFYNVVSTCTAVMADSGLPIVSTNNYTASISTSQINNCFELIPLYIGADYVVPYTSLNGNAIGVGFYSPEYDLSSVSSGTLSASKTTFTIESRVYRYSPRISYFTKNVFTKQVTEIANKN